MKKATMNHPPISPQTLKRAFRAVKFPKDGISRLASVLVISMTALPGVSRAAFKDISDPANLLQGKAVACNAPFNDGGIGRVNNGLGDYDLIGTGNYDWYPGNAIAITGLNSSIGIVRVWCSPFSTDVRKIPGFAFKSSTTNLTSGAQLIAANYETDLGDHPLPLAAPPTVSAGWTYVDATGFDVPNLYYYDITVSAPSGTKSLWIHLNGPAWAQNLIEVQAFVPPPAPPTVAITSPANNATVSTNFTINATAADEGSVTSVEFHDGPTLLGTADTPPYSWNVLGASAGAHALTAVAWDNDGNSTTSDVVNVTVTLVNLPPEVTLTSPADAAVFVEGTDIPLAATATDDGGVASVDFLVDDAVVFTATVEPYAYTWTGAVPGGHTVKAVARDGPGLATTSSVANITVNANQPPEVTLTSPTDTAAFIIGTAIPLAATATDDGGVASVDFVVDDVVLDTDTSAPYAYSWAGAALGGHTVVAVARDGSGLETNSAVANITVTVDPNVITNPLNLLAGKTIAGQHFWYAANGSGLACLVDNLANTWCMFSGPPADNYVPDTDLRVSVSGFNSAVGTVRYWGDPYANRGGNRALNGVTIYSSTTATTSLDPAEYTLCGDFSIPLGNPVPAGWTLVPGAGAYFDVAISAPPGTQSLLLKFKNAGIAGNFANLFNEIQAFASSSAPVGYDAWAGPDGYNLTGADADRNADPDGDGFTNLQEFLFGTSPIAGNGSLVNSETGGGNFVLHWLQRAGGVGYLLQESTTMAAGEWSPSAIVPELDDQTGVPTDYVRYQAVIPIDAARKFFRVEGTEN
ncbi:MAG: Ig-like domain-containing protein [Verrucomicrobia bacterium]|nr:Ig-like domain-containing protein [Verrucomicrobiota bacterium]